jgi:hypothetical protein
MFHSFERLRSVGAIFTPLAQLLDGEQCLSVYSSQ